MQAFFELALPWWSALVFAVFFSLLIYGVRNWMYVWSLLTLPATVLHELAHALTGAFLGAQPTTWSLWPKRVSKSKWQLGYVKFNRLRWWNGGAVALAPLAWTLVFPIALKGVAHLPSELPVWISVLLGISVVLIWKAIAPSKSDWKLAAEYWPSAVIFLGLLGWMVFYFTASLWS